MSDSTVPSSSPPHGADSSGDAPALFRTANYRYHWLSTALSCMGDYFTLIAMPWLVLSLTRDPAALGTVMALESLPRAAFMLVGGKAIDRYSPRSVLLVSKTLFLVGLSLLAWFLLSGMLSLQLLYGFAFCFGLLTAFAMPASMALLPQLINGEKIQQANSALMGTQQLIQLFAPVLAGLLIWGVASPEPGAALADVSRIAYAFLVNAASVALAVLVMLRIRVTPAAAGESEGPEEIHLRDGFGYLWQDRGLRIVTLYVALIAFFAIGPVMTAIPQFAAERLGDGALSYGVLYAINGFGALIGFGAAGLLPKPGLRQVGLVLFGADLIAGACVFGFGQGSALLSAAPALVIMGMANSYGGVVALSWMQERIPMALAGRVLGIAMFAMMGLTPVSMALSGYFVAYYSLTALLTLSGSVIALLSLTGLLIPGMNRFGAYPIPVLPEAA